MGVPEGQANPDPKYEIKIDDVIYLIVHNINFIAERISARL